MINPSRALRLLLARTKAMPAVRVPLARALGRVAARAIRAPFDLPRFASSSMDGYAVSSAATRRATAAAPVRLRIARRVNYAGSPPGPTVRADTAVRIMTGAPLPSGVDAVLAQENVRIERGSLVITRPVRRGRHVRRAAEDCRRGGRVVDAGMTLHPGSLGLLSMLGIRHVWVRRAPCVAIVVTGSEVRPPGARSLPAFAVRDSHAAFLVAALQEFDIEPVRVGFARDSAPAIRREVAGALARADLVIVTGGVSVGDRDLVKPVLRSLNVRTVFWRVAQKPGKPLYFGRRRGTAVLGLPGNPASTVVCYCEYVRPAIRRMLGEVRGEPETWEARLSAPVRRDAARTEFLRGRLTRRGSDWHVSPARQQASNLLGSFLGSDCVIVVPRGSRALRAGSRVRVHPLPWRRG